MKKKPDLDWGLMRKSSWRKWCSSWQTSGHRLDEMSGWWRSFRLWQHRVHGLGLEGSSAEMMPIGRTYETQGEMAWDRSREKDRKGWDNWGRGSEVIWGILPFILKVMGNHWRTGEWHNQSCFGKKTLLEKKGRETTEEKGRLSSPGGRQPGRESGNGRN